MSEGNNKSKSWGDFSRHYNEQSVGEVLSQITSKGLLADKFTEIQIVAIYEEIVGIQIAKLTEKLTVKKGKLYLQFSSSALKQEMVYARTKVMNQINAKLTDKSIDEIIIL
ncbi:MAG: hypothetical protein AUJ98_03835 [Bacteroidetes bacterium CG2_30_33_31]|nr:MAG: hypothetical protein AUJ98_03835 [Bacteroidetes bacterium CG2_30_33_31]